MSKKLFAMLLALVMLLGVSNIALAEDPIELHFVCAYAANYGMQDLIDDFEAQHPNIKIILDVYNNSSDGNQAVDNMLMAGGLIDLQLAYGLVRPLTSMSIWTSVLLSGASTCRRPSAWTSSSATVRVNSTTSVSPWMPCSGISALT